jgi:hypothetical protein
MGLGASDHILDANIRHGLKLLVISFGLLEDRNQLPDPQIFHSG